MAKTAYLLMKQAALHEIVKAIDDERVPILDYADLRQTDLRETDLSGGSMRWADLSDADLRGAYICGAFLHGANSQWCES